MRSIAGQQLSVKAAAAIWRKLIARYDGRTPTPAEILADDPEELRAAAGFSRAKVTYLRSLAEHVLDESLELHKLQDLPDEQVIAELTAVKGIGEWTAQMFLMFTLHRPDVLPLGDLGVRNAIARHYEARTGHRGLAPAPHARLPVPLAQPRQRTASNPVGCVAALDEPTACTPSHRRSARSIAPPRPPWPPTRCRSTSPSSPTSRSATSSRARRSRPTTRRSATRR